MKKILTLIISTILIFTTSVSVISCKESKTINLTNSKDIIYLKDLKYFKDNWYLQNDRDSDVVEMIIKIIKSWPEYNFYATKIDENIIINYTESRTIRIVANPNQKQYIGFFDFIYSKWL